MIEQQDRAALRRNYLEDEPGSIRDRESLELQLLGTTKLGFQITEARA